MFTKASGKILWFSAVLCVAGSLPAKADEPQALTDPFYAMQNPKRTLRGAALTDAQMAEILEYRKRTTWEREKALLEERDALWRKFTDLYAGDGAVDPEALMDLAKRATQLNGESEVLKAQVMLKMRSVLTPEQLRRVAETHEKLKSLDAQRDELDAQRKVFDPTVAAERGK